MNKFKIGDKVRCIEGWANIVAFGKTYRVISIACEEHIGVDAPDANPIGFANCCSETRFVKVIPNGEKQ